MYGVYAPDADAIRDLLRERDLSFVQPHCAYLIVLAKVLDHSAIHFLARFSETLHLESGEAVAILVLFDDVTACPSEHDRRQQARTDRGRDGDGSTRRRGRRQRQRGPAGRTGLRTLTHGTGEGDPDVATLESRCAAARRERRLSRNPRGIDPGLLQPELEDRRSRRKRAGPGSTSIARPPRRGPLDSQGATQLAGDLGRGRPADPAGQVHRVARGRCRPGSR